MHVVFRIGCILITAITGLLLSNSDFSANRLFITEDIQESADVASNTVKPVSGLCIVSLTLVLTLASAKLLITKGAYLDV